MSYFNTGNEIVDAVGEMNIVGDVVPPAWFYTVHGEDGKANLLAIFLLANIVYWYRPRQVRDEVSGVLLRWDKRFYMQEGKNLWQSLALYLWKQILE